MMAILRQRPRSEVVCTEALLVATEPEVECIWSWTSCHLMRVPIFRMPDDVRCGCFFDCLGACLLLSLFLSLFFLVCCVGYTFVQLLLKFVDGLACRPACRFRLLWALFLLRLLILAGGRRGRLILAGGIRFAVSRASDANR